jgi:hypothetical protein
MAKCKHCDGTGTWWEGESPDMPPWVYKVMADEEQAKEVFPPGATVEDLWAQNVLSFIGCPWCGGTGQEEHSTGS